MADRLPAQQPGHRLHGESELPRILEADGPIGQIVQTVMDGTSRPVRALLFDKTSANNWALGWHQDRTIVVRDRRTVEGFGPWTTKQGLLHVTPPIQVLEGMVTVRVHLDPVPVSNAPLLVAPGSHRFGRIAESDVLDAVARCGTFTCLADAGDVWVYSTPILHASDAASQPRRRRVQQVDYAARHLPGGLEWLGLD